MMHAQVVRELQLYNINNHDRGADKKRLKSTSIGHYFHSQADSKGLSHTNCPKQATPNKRRLLFFCSLVVTMGREGETTDMSTNSSSSPPPTQPPEQGGGSGGQKPRRNSLSRLSSLRRNSLNSGDDLSVLSGDDKLNGALDDEAREVRGLARKETFKVQILRLIVAICIVGAGTVISIYTYRVLKEEEEQDSQASVRVDTMRARKEKERYT